MPDEGTLLDQALDGIDLVVDATAELGVQLYLADVCRARGTTLVTVEGREGGYGGLVARYRAGARGCYRCLKLHQRDGKFLPPRDSRTGRTQPRGCSRPTFTGAAFDLLPLAAQAARLSAQTLSASQSFSDTTRDLSIFFARADSSGAVDGTPAWEHHALTPHLECPQCCES
jgi:molybdopterin/thiamine biosynthesis adenylyltransferase